MGKRKSNKSNLPILKVYDIDYSFIIKNYLDPSLWTKSWLLFCYKNFNVHISLSKIYCSEGKISFKVKVSDGINEEEYHSAGIFYDNYDLGWVYYNLNTDNIDILKKSIISTVERSIMCLEEKLIQLDSGYKDIEDTIDKKKRLLEQIAEDFLDDNNVTNSDIREAYVNWYLDKMDDNNNLKSDYIDSRRYQILTDVWYTWAQATNDENLNEKIASSCSAEKFEQVKNDYEEYKNYLESQEFKEEAMDELEDI